MKTSACHGWEPDCPSGRREDHRDWPHRTFLAMPDVLRLHPHGGAGGLNVNRSGPWEAQLHEARNAAILEHEVCRMVLRLDQAALRKYWKTSKGSHTTWALRHPPLLDCLSARGRFAKEVVQLDKNKFISSISKVYDCSLAAFHMNFRCGPLLRTTPETPRVLTCSEKVQNMWKSTPLVNTNAVDWRGA